MLSNSAVVNPTETISSCRVAPCILAHMKSVNKTIYTSHPCPLNFTLVWTLTYCPAKPRLSCMRVRLICDSRSSGSFLLALMLTLMLLFWSLLLFLSFNLLLLLYLLFYLHALLIHTSDRELYQIK